MNSGFQAEDFQLMYGFNGIDDPNATWVEADELISHHLYRRGVTKFNIGLIKLKEKITFGTRVKVIKLPTIDDINSTYPAVASGFGMLHVSNVV